MAVKEGGIGALPIRELYLEEAARCLFTAQNTMTVQNSIEAWMKNFKENIKQLPRDAGWIKKTLSGYAAIVVGAGPSITDAQMEALKGYKGMVFGTNKSMTRLLEHGIRPDVVCVLHTTNEILPHFSTEAIAKAMSNDISGMTQWTWCLTTCLHPDVIKAARQVSGNMSHEYWCNPAIPEEQLENVGHFMEIMSGLPCIDTGGNVGIFAMLCAAQFGCNPIGLLGMEHAFFLDKKWTVEQALGYRIEWNPEDDQTYAITPSFQTYLDGLVKYWRYYDGKGIKIINLSPFGPLFARRKTLMPFLDVSEFVRG